MISRLAISSLFDELDRKTLILTPNRRLSATLHKLYHDYQVNQGLTCWNTPDILPINTWLTRLWSDANQLYDVEQKILLNATQENYLWESIISRSKENELILQTTETAELAKSAWALLKNWQVDLNHVAFSSAADYTAYQRWAHDFSEACKSNNWITSAELPSTIMRSLSTENIILPKKIIMVGFTELSPLLSELFNKCIKANCNVTSQSLAVTPVSCQRTSLLDTDAEITLLARWAKQRLVEHPKARIGCIIPTLESIRDRVWQIFSEVFAKDKAHTIDSEVAPFNISAGKCLREYPIIKSGLELLSLHQSKLSREVLYHLLSSPYVGEAETERLPRSQFDTLLREKNIATFDLKSSNPAYALTNHCPLLADRINKLLSVTEQITGTKTYHEWAQHFSSFLAIMGWPGERNISSEEYQVIEHWLELLDELSTLDHIASPIPLQSALSRLNKLVSKSIFQAKTPEAPIQVLGLLEAASSPFDYLWVTGMDDSTWPPQPHPHPLLPKSLQRELNMPHATAERELLYCQSMTTQLIECSQYSIFSHSQQESSVEAQMSPLLRTLTEISASEIMVADYTPPAIEIQQAAKIEHLVDENAPPLTIDNHTHGGVSIIKYQAMCPFKSFAENRLYARELESTHDGLTSKERGSITHKILEIIWDRLNNHAALIALKDEVLHQIISESITKALGSIHLARQSQYIKLEDIRLHSLIWDWLQVEKSRPDFTVLSHEKKVTLALNHLKLSLRIDRIDEVLPGKSLIIDYKTGKNITLSDLFDERPTEPQLALYALLNPTNTIGVTFAQIIPGKPNFKGVSNPSLDINGIRPIAEYSFAGGTEWSEQLNFWKLILGKLADDYCSGVAKVHPKNNATTCQYCKLQPLCRINEEARIQ